MTRQIDVPEETLQRLRADTERAAEVHGAPSRDDSAPRAGDLFVSPASADQDVEWLIAAGRDGEVLAVAADPSPRVGSGDVEVPQEAAGGPLVLHCRCAAWVDPGSFDPQHRTGRLEQRWAEAARLRWQRLESGAHRGSPLERETDADPAYQERAGELAAARDALLRHAAARERQRQRDRFAGRGAGTSPAWSRAAAAVLLVALGAALWWGGGLWRRVEKLTAPSVVPERKEIPLGSTVRGEPFEIRPSPSSRWILLHLVAEAGELPSSDNYRVVVLDAEGRLRVRLDIVFDRLGETFVILPRTDFPPGRYTLRIEDAAADPPRTLDEEILRILPPA